jgi:hypothetical protein
MVMACPLRKSGCGSKVKARESMFGNVEYCSAGDKCPFPKRLDTAERFENSESHRVTVY